MSYDADLLREGGEAAQAVAIDYIQRGVTPKLLKQAYDTGTARELPEKLGVKARVITALARRWGIRKYQ